MKKACKPKAGLFKSYDNDKIRLSRYNYGVTTTLERWALAHLSLFIKDSKYVALSSLVVQEMIG